MLNFGGDMSFIHWSYLTAVRYDICDIPLEAFEFERRGNFWSQKKQVGHGHLESKQITKTATLGGGFKYFFIFSPKIREMIHFD